MADLAPSWDVGEAVVEIWSETFEVASGKSATKGRVAVFSGSVSDGYPTVEDGGADSLAVAGVFTETKSAGAKVRVLRIGVVKVNNTGAITVGNCVKCGANGAVVAMPGTKVAGDEEKIVGRSLHGPTEDGQLLIQVGMI